MALLKYNKFKESFMVNDKGELVGVDSEAEDMDRISKELDDLLYDEYYEKWPLRHELRGFALEHNYDTDDITWVTENENYQIEVDLFHNHQYTLGITLYKKVSADDPDENYEVGEWKDIQTEEVSLDPSIINGYIEDIKDKYLIELFNFIDGIELDGMSGPDEDLFA